LTTKEIPNLGGVRIPQEEFETQICQLLIKSPPSSKIKVQTEKVRNQPNISRSTKAILIGLEVK
jgi:hypothetical protein